MGAYTSREACDQQGFRLICDTVPVNATDFSTVTEVAGFGRGEYPENSDIAGIGVLGTFLAVTVISLVCSIISTVWWWIKNISPWKARMEENENVATKPYRFSFAGFLEAIVITCSDQQIFTGCAYAVTLRYVTGCEISAYHYNIVANMLLVTCATHLTAVTVSRNYWENPWPSAIRIILTALLYIITGIVISNTGAASVKFPTAVPDDSARYDPLLLPAACFQTDSAHISDTIQNSVSSSREFFGSAIPGWSNYLFMFVCYALAVIVRLVSVVRAGNNKERGRRRRIVAWTKRRFSFFFQGVPRRILNLIFGLYLLAGNGVGIWTVWSSGWFVFRLRRWVGNSGWFSPKGKYTNPEDDPNSFGQLVPLFLNLLLLFAIVQFLANEARLRNERKKIRRRHEYALSVARTNSENPYLLEENLVSPSTEKKASTFDVVVKPVKPTGSGSGSDGGNDSPSLGDDAITPVNTTPLDERVPDAGTRRLSKSSTQVSKTSSSSPPKQTKTQTQTTPSIVIDPAVQPTPPRAPPKDETNMEGEKKQKSA